MVKCVEKNICQNLIFRHAGTVLCSVHMCDEHAAIRNCSPDKKRPRKERKGKRKDISPSDIIMHTEARK